MTDEICKAKKEAMTTLVRGFYHDFMPMVQQIKDDVSALHIDEQDKEAIGRINEQLRQAESLLRQLMTITVKHTKTDMTKVALNIIKNETLDDNPALKGRRLLVKVDKDYIYVQSATKGKIDLLDKNYVKVKEIDIKELEK